MKQMPCLWGFSGDATRCSLRWPRYKPGAELARAPSRHVWSRTPKRAPNKHRSQIGPFWGISGRPSGSVGVAKTVRIRGSPCASSVRPRASCKTRSTRLTGHGASPSRSFRVGCDSNDWLRSRNGHRTQTRAPRQKSQAGARSDGGGPSPNPPPSARQPRRG